MPSEIVQLFQNEDFGTLRAIAVDETPCFVAKDVCDALGLGRQQDSTRYLDEDEKGECLVDTSSGTQRMVVVTEAGLYSLIMRSRKPEAKAFRRWVTHDVLPSIRKHGMYATPQTVEDMLNDPDTMIATLKALKAERQKVQALVEDNSRMLPKAVAYDSFIETNGTMTVTEAARYMTQMGSKVSVQRLYALLRADELICKRGNAPTRKAIDRGLAVQVMTTRPDGKANDPYARLTQKGLDWCVSHYAQIPTQMRT